MIVFYKSNKILLIGIVSNKESTLFKSSNIKLFIPEVKESGYGIVPTSKFKTRTRKICERKVLNEKR